MKTTILLGFLLAIQGCRTTDSKILSNPQNYCDESISRVRNNYSDKWFQNGDRAGEILACKKTVDANNDRAQQNGDYRSIWTPLMRDYYCEYPGIPVRLCFRDTAIEERKTRSTQQEAYDWAFYKCKKNGSFDSVTLQMQSNFSQIMLDKIPCN